MPQYHVFPLETKTFENPKTEVEMVDNKLYGVVLSDGVVTGQFSREEYLVLTDCRPYTEFSVQQASTPQEAAQKAVREWSK
jgi:hypothetical protein